MSVETSPPLVGCSRHEFRKAPEYSLTCCNCGSIQPNFTASFSGLYLLFGVIKAEVHPEHASVDTPQYSTSTLTLFDNLKGRNSMLLQNIKVGAVEPGRGSWYTRRCYPWGRKAGNACSASTWLESKGGRWLESKAPE